MNWMIAAALGSLLACGSSKEAPGKGNDLEAMKDEASVEWARKQIGELDSKLASDDPGSASSTCAVIKPDLAKIKQADPTLAATLERKCGRDLAVRSMTVAVERAEQDRFECSSVSVYEKMITKAGAESDPEVAKLRERVATACAKK